jgi:Flp pilus assembly protein TadD
MRGPLSAIGLVMSVPAIALAGCSSTASGTRLTHQEEAVSQRMQARSIAPATAEEREAVRRQDLMTQAAFWAEAYELNPGDREAAIELSGVLRQIGQTERSGEVARQALTLFPEDAALQANYGMALVAEGQGQRAIEPLTRAAGSRGDDWRVLNALGVALEQAGRGEAARERFAQARALEPREPAILSNLALSHALAGEPERAETMLREAMNDDRAGPQVRQNLALVLALQGRFNEAERIAVIDSSPEVAEANLAYVRSMLSSPRRWDNLEGAGLRR